jgi:PadR family transcriptional regulator, regulatory protein AphA
MNKAMSLTHAILGVLKREPMTGYDLKTRRFDGTISHFWTADQAQIYRTLEKLTEQNLVRAELVIQEGAPNRKVYSLTPEGETELHDWLAQGQEIPPFRDAFLVQLFFGENLSNEELLALIERQLAYHQQRLANFNCVESVPLGTPGATREQVLRRMVLECGLTTVGAKISWLEKCRTIVQSLPEDKST